MTTTINFGGATIVNNKVASNLENTFPAVWAVAGETTDRIGGAAINTTTNSGSVFKGTRKNKPIWNISGSNSSIDVATTINSTTKDWTVAVAVGNLTFSSGATPLFFTQIVADNDVSNHVNHYVAFTPSTLTFAVDEFEPAAGAATLIINGSLPTDSVIVFVHSSTSSGDFTVYVDGTSMGTVAHTETYSGSAPTLMRVGNRTNNSQNDSTGMQVYAFAVWPSALSIADVRKLTIDSMTGPYGPPTVIESGLVMHLDAGNTASYPGTGTTWTDLTGNGNNVTMVNSGNITFNTGNGGYFSTTGLNGYFTGPGTASIPVGNDPYTLMAWIRVPAWSARAGIVMLGGTGTNSLNLLSLGTSLGFMTNHWFNRDLNSNNNNAGLSLNTWFLVTAEYDLTTRRLFGNTTITASDVPDPGTHNTSSSTINIGNYPPVPWQLIGDIGAAYIYDRALTETEITQNFSANRARFGI